MSRYSNKDNVLNYIYFLFLYQYKTFKRYFTHFATELSVEREWQREGECGERTHHTVIHIQNWAQTKVAHSVRAFAIHVNKCKSLLYSFLVYSKWCDEKYRWFYTGAIWWYNTIKMYMVHLWIHRLIAFPRSKWSFQTCRVVAMTEKWQEKKGGAYKIKCKWYSNYPRILHGVLC